MQILEALNALHEQKKSYVVVTLIQVEGSAPQDIGAKAIVTFEGLFAGTVGGGKVEAKAIEVAQQILNKKNNLVKVEKWNLQKDVGMTCGGVVHLLFESFTFKKWEIVIFGAGHVAQALVRTLIRLQCSVTCFDTRKEWIEKLPDDKNLRKVMKEDLVSTVEVLSPNSFILLMTMGHSTDAPILKKILEQPPFPYLGVIGSKAKRNSLEKYLTENGIEKFKQRFICPIGLPIGDNSPEEIAISVTAELLQKRDELISAEI